MQTTPPLLADSQDARATATRASFLKTLGAMIADSGEAYLPPGPLVVGCSGGPDSCALALGLALLNSQQARWQLRLVYVHHHVRPANDTEALFVRELAQQLGCAFEVYHLTGCASTSGSREDALRSERYRLLAEAAAACGSRYVVVGHHADDNAETVLFRILRGTGLRGLGGMRAMRRLAPQGPHLARPLLHLRRSALEAFVSTFAITPCLDASNSDPEAATRNWLRQTLLPVIDGRFPHATDHLVHLAETAQSAWSICLETSERYLADNGLEATLPKALPTELVNQAPPAVQAQLVRRWARDHKLGELSRLHTLALVGLCQREIRDHAHTLPHGASVRRAHGLLHIVAPTSSWVPPARAWPQCSPRIHLAAPGTTALVDRPIEIVVRELDRLPANLENRACLWLDKSALDSRPLAVRGPQRGDRMRPRALGGSKKLQDLFVDAKVPSSQRGEQLVVVAGDEIAGVLGLRVDERFAATRTSAGVVEIRCQVVTPEP